MIIAVTGANGGLGRSTIAALKACIPSSSILALVRSPEKAADLGVEVRSFDYDKSPEQLAQSLKGVDVLLLISSADLGKRGEQHGNVIKAAKIAGVKRIVYTSIVNADTSLLSLAEEHRETESALREAGVPFTILRNGWYAENPLHGLEGVRASGKLIRSAGNGKISFATRDDLAEAAAIVLTGTGHEGKVYELGGDTPYTMADCAAELSKHFGRDIPYADLPVEQYAGILAGVGMPAPFAQAVASWDAAASKGSLFHDGNDLRTLLGRPTVPISAVIAQVAK
ncbi:hypothetical protein L288_15650 [Sphingobium quisquiliarum P25]|uniref:NAD(P)-binding domain-containing protein n=2 Tax=Sphingobium quisquiliarum TaxID=538379 RepID=T0GGM8_9SPHN|nr:hypothetical protein L288_15650 [Sphingobium quisquiliarum P25]